ncbi:beta-1,4-glucuronyltransferase 1-like [Penaeus japonicus]|uniref:beta-1,4-glucuronyltransferase 1-like n=1 Tax=Penaeus japonicus TaxID=27405 RepID=UPI001C71347C|nr:beta-1,4-glucuronyltransferase 1-like [Penaeus japonicus]XP_042877310.1 beta-1,4-glucuronyltransferase 1-like [Penaeus japonicus]
MVMTKKFLVLNMAIVLANAAIGLFLNLAIFSGPVGVRERFVVLPDEYVPDEAPVLEFLTEDSPVNGSDQEVNKCQKTTESRNIPFDMSRGLLDKSRVFKTHPFVIPGQHWENVTSSWKVCMSLQTSVDFLFWLSKQAEMWSGPISVAVFTPDADYTIALRMIKYLKTCNPEGMSRVSFHVAYPTKHPPRYVPIKDDVVKEYNCDAPETVNQELIRELRSEELLQMIKNSRYPQNLLRNVAREGCPSDFAFTPDVDMIPIPHMSDDLNEFLAKSPEAQCNKCAFVVPTYEIHTAVTTNPKDKAELRQLIIKRRAQRFHIRAFAPNQANSNLAKWERTKITDKLQVLYNITTWRNYWEPIYVTKANVPPFDERFVGYGFTRNSQVYEMHVADYTWRMLSNVFLCHRGFQTTKTHTKARRAQIRDNSKKYQAFRKELYARYGKNPNDYEPKKNTDKKTLVAKKDAENIKSKPKATGAKSKN